MGDNNSGKGKSGWVRAEGRFHKAEGKMVSIGVQWFICLSILSHSVNPRDGGA